jgi:hypothetical protein
LTPVEVGLDQDGEIECRWHQVETTNVAEDWASWDRYLPAKIWLN